VDATQVKDVMTPDVTTLTRNEQLSLADDLMNLGRIRHLSMLDDDGIELIGIVSQRDLFRGAIFSGERSPVPWDRASTDAGSCSTRSRSKT
jgi:CBS-domain-containing membrane protein